MCRKANNVRTVTMCSVVLGLMMARTKAWTETLNQPCVMRAWERMKTLTAATNISKLTKELENVVTIDGRGRPKKALLFLELIQEFGIEAVMEELKKFSKRKFF